MIYDCFLFFNELDILEIRLNELYDVVDKFVIVESGQTFSGKQKELLFWKNKIRYKKWSDKIIWINSPVINRSLWNKWRIEKFQRDCIQRGLTECNPDDIILISDVDEIPSAFWVKKLPYWDMSKPTVFVQSFYYYYLNGQKSKEWNGTIACLYEQLITPQKMRDRRNSWFVYQLTEGGWHFSFVGSPTQIQDKISAFSHREFDKPKFTNRYEIIEKITMGKDLFGRRGEDIKYVPIDDTFPKEIFENQEKWKHLIKEIK